MKVKKAKKSFTLNKDNKYTQR